MHLYQRQVVNDRCLFGISINLVSVCGDCMARASRPLASPFQVDNFGNANFQGIEMNYCLSLNIIAGILPCEGPRPG